MLTNIHTPIKVPPLLLHAAAHWDQEKAKHALRTCSQSTCAHPRIAALREPEMSSEVAAFLDGTALRDLPLLSDHIAELRFGFSAERLVEGGHTTVHLHAAGARNRTEANDSLCLRLPELKSSLVRDTEFFKEFVAGLHTVRTPRKVCSVLGLNNHPSFQLAKRSRGFIYRKVVNHSDPFSLFHSRPNVHCNG